MLERQQQEKKTREHTIENAPDSTEARTQFAELRLGSVKWCGVQANGVDRADR